MKKDRSFCSLNYAVHIPRNEPIEIPPTNVPMNRLTKNLAVLIGNMITSSGLIGGSVAVPAIMLFRLKAKVSTCPGPFAGKSIFCWSQLSIDTTRSSKSLGERILSTQWIRTWFAYRTINENTFRSPVR